MRTLCEWDVAEQALTALYLPTSVGISVDQYPGIHASSPDGSNAMDESKTLNSISFPSTNFKPLLRPRGQLQLPRYTQIQILAYGDLG